MKQRIFNTALITILGFLLFQSCTKKLDLQPTNDVTSEVVYSTPMGYKQVLAKTYGAFALTGNQGPAGSGDVQGIDEGFSDFFRLYWKAQELTTDEAVIAWGDVGIQDFHNMNWSSNNPFLTGLYYRSLYQITLANELIRESAPEKVSGRGITGADATNIQQYAREARFLRAYQYWVLMDLYGNPPFVDENTPIGAVPEQATRSEIFEFIEDELLAIEPDMPAARSNEYGRADKGAVWALLARLYLNAAIYTGAPRYADAITYSKKVIDAGYSLISNYHWLMLADNHLNTDEFIFTINYDGVKTQGFGGTTFLTHASVGGSSMSPAAFGVGGGWGGIRTTKNLVNLFPDVTGAQDKRAQFYIEGQNIEIADQTQFTQGYAVTKYRNLRRNGSAGQSPDYSDIDIPLFRLAEMYLIYAEAVVRSGATANLPAATEYINNLRTRAYGNTSGNITSGQLTLDFILDERARELYWEGHRRTDLVRYDRFTTATYLWPWKGGIPSGTGVASYRNIFPIPSRDLNVNVNLTQNPGY